MPLVYAVTLGLAFNLAGLVVPEPIMKSVDLVSGAAVPVMLVGRHGHTQKSAVASALQSRAIAWLVAEQEAALLGTVTTTV